MNSIRSRVYYYSKLGFSVGRGPTDVNYLQEMGDYSCIK